MRQANCKCVTKTIYKGLEAVRISDADRLRARYALRRADAIVDAVIWVMERTEALGAVIPKLGFKH
jgi:hypothetical protein